MHEPTRWTFASFEIDLSAGVLRKSGEPVRIGPQAFRALRLLVSRGGELVTREELQKEIWGDRVHVDYDRGLNECIRQVRAAMCDGAQGSRIIVTCPREGYRLGVPVAPIAAQQPRRNQRWQQLQLRVVQALSSQQWRVAAAVLTIVSAAYLVAHSATPESQPPAALSSPSGLPVATSGAAFQPGTGERIHSSSALFARPASVPNVDAYSWYMRGRAFYDRSTGRRPYGAVPYFERAVALAPNFAIAQAALAASYIDKFAAGILPEDSALKAKQAAQRAVALDDSLPETHLSLAELNYRLNGDAGNADREFTRAVSLDGRNAYVRQRYAMFLEGQGRLDDALAQLGVAQDLDPLSIVSSWQKAYTLFLARRWEASMAQARRTLELDPKHAPSLRLIGDCLEAMGRREEAITAYQQAGEPAFGKLGRLYALMGRRAEAGDIVKALTRDEDIARNGIAIAYIYIGLGEPLAALQWLGKAHDAGRQLPVSLRVSPQWETLRASRAFSEFIKENPANGL